MRNRDAEILGKLQTDGERAMHLMYQQYYSMLSLKALRYVKKEEVAEDLVQELFVDIWKRRDNFNITSSLSGYLQRSIVNRSLNWIRSNKIIHEEIEEQTLNRVDESKADKTLEGEELEDFINSVIDSLPEKCRLVFVMSRFDQLSYKEIGTKLDISVKTVENQISKALKILRANLEKYSKI